MKFRIKQKGDLEYARYYPQKNGWKTMWIWEYFHVSYYEIPSYVQYNKKHNIQPEYRVDDYTELFYKTKKEAEDYIEKYKAKIFEKKYEVLSKNETRRKKKSKTN